MSTFEFDKPIKDIEEPELLPVDWTPVELTEDPTIGPNGALRAILEENGIEFDSAPDPQIMDLIRSDSKGSAGLTMTIKTKVIHPDPRYDGRPMTMWLAWPSEVDHERYTRTGQTKYDARYQKLVDLSAALGGNPKGKSIKIDQGMRCQVYVNQRKSQNSEEIENFIDAFAGFKPYST